MTQRVAQTSLPFNFPSLRRIYALSLDLVISSGTSCPTTPITPKGFDCWHVPQRRVYRRRKGSLQNTQVTHRRHRQEFLFGLRLSNLPKYRRIHLGNWCYPVSDCGIQFRPIQFVSKSLSALGCPWISKPRCGCFITLISNSSCLRLLHSTTSPAG
jgi:hypothetical protein